MKRNNNKFRFLAILSVFCLLLITGYPVESRADAQGTWNQLLEQSQSLFEQEKFEEAVNKAVQALEYAQNNFGDESQQTVISMSMLAGYYSNLGYPEEALPIYNQALLLAKKVLGEDHLETLQIMKDIGQLYADQGQYDEAKTLYKNAYEKMKVSLGESDPETLYVMTSLAQMYQAQGEFQEAETLLMGAVEMYEKIAEADFPDALIAKETLASVYKTQGKFEKSESIYQQVLQQKQASLGEKNVETIITMSDLAELYQRMGKYEQSETLFVQAIQLFKEVAGEEDPDLFQTMGSLAQLYQDQGRYAEAEALYLKVWEFDRSTLGEKHPNTIIDLNNLAGLNRLRGEYGKAESQYQEAFSYIKEALGEKHPETISIMNNLSLLYENEGLFDRSEPLYKSALRFSQEELGPEHPTTLALMNNLASLYESQGVFDKSETMYKQAILLNEKVYGVDHPNTIAGINNLGYLYLMQSNFSDAEPLFSRVFDTWKNQLGEKHQKTLKSMNNFGRVNQGLGKSDQAELLVSQALAFRKEVLGESHPDVVRSMIDLGNIYLSQKKYTDAEPLMKNTIALSEKILGDKHQYTFEALNSLADLYEKTGQLDKSLSVRNTGFDRRSIFFDRVLWAAGENTRQSYIELHKPEQDRFLSLLLRLNTAETSKMALYASLQRKGLLLKISSEIQKIVEMTESPELSAMAKSLNDKRKELASMTLSGPTTETPEEFNKKTAKLESEVDELQAELGRASMIFHITSQPISVERVFENLTADDVLVDFLAYNDDGTQKVFAVVAQAAEESCFAWWKCKDSKINLVPIGDVETIRQKVSIFRETIQDEESEEDDILDTGADIYNLVWAPLRNLLGDKKSIYIVPDSVLHLLPFDAMVDENGNYLIQSRDIKVLSSSRDLVVAALPDAQGQFMILAGPDYDLEDATTKEKKVAISGRRSATGNGMRIASTGLRSLSFDPLLGAELEGETIKKVSDAFEKLPGAEDEGKVIQKVAKGGKINSVIYLKAEAEEQQLRTLKSAPKMLHIATHGFFLKAEERLKKRLLSLNRGGTLSPPPPGDNPLLRAGLAFAGINTNAPFLGEIDTNNDGVLTALEVLGLPLSGTQLVVLSACETGVGEIHAGEGVYGLRRAFQEAGAKSVVNSLWPVSDEATRKLMTEFYDRMFKGVPTRQALKQAQLALLNSEWNNPYYWAAFVLVERRFSASN